MSIKKVTVVGGGLMGRQIALNSAIYGYNTIVYDKFAKVLDEVTAWADDYLDDRIKKGKMTPEKVEEIKKNFMVEADMEKAVQDADFVLEAIIEKESAKRDLFKEIGPYMKKGCIIATNSSYMCSSLFKDDVPDASLLCNCHFYNPALQMKFVEVVQGEHTAKSTIEEVMEYCRNSGKHPIWMKKEIPGFAANRIVQVIREEAFSLVENGYLSFEDMDAACELGLGHSLGPFRLTDLVGINLAYQILNDEFEETGVKPAGYEMIKAHYDKGEYGQSTGKGFYDYTKN
ncbi:MAG: 3-hydroxyacyl-CoA dehydrogenase family protein [Anaerovoracaceae bacterium]